MAERVSLALPVPGAPRLVAPLLAVVVVATLAGCSVGGGNLLGGREKCWDEGEPRMAAIMEGTLRIGPPGTYLANPNEDDLPLLPGALSITTTPDGVRLVDAGGTVAAAEGESLTLFGGIGADGMVVCAVEGRQAP